MSSPALRPRRTALGAALIALLAVAGCQTALDLERARSLFEREQRPEVPVLVEAKQPTLPAPEGLRATPDELRRVPLRWDPVLDGDVAGYVVERALDPEGPYERVAILPGRFHTSWVDRGSDFAVKANPERSTHGLADGQRFSYRVRAFDAEGVLASPPSQPVTATTAPPPEPPRALRAFSHLPRKVALTWDPSPDPTTAGYVVLRSPTERGEFLPVARLHGRYTTVYEDRGLGDLRVFYYRIASWNEAGAEGPPTDPERAVTKPVPLPPAGLALEAREIGRNVLSWRPNVEVDLAGYRLLRRREGAEEFEEVAVLPAHVTEAEDRQVLPGERVAYALRAFDRDGLESAASDPIQVESRRFGLRAHVEDGDVHLRWDPEAQAAFEQTRVLLEGLRSRELARVPSEGFVDAAPPSGTRRYRLIGVRPSGQESPPSAPVEIEVPERAEGAPAD